MRWDVELLLDWTGWRKSMTRELPEANPADSLPASVDDDTHASVQYHPARVETRAGATQGHLGTRTETYLHAVSVPPRTLWSYCPMATTLLTCITLAEYKIQIFLERLGCSRFR